MYWLRCAWSGQGVRSFGCAGRVRLSFQGGASTTFWSKRPLRGESNYARELLPGYGWLIPESAQRANIGVCVDATRLSRSAGLRELLARFEKQHLGSRLGGARAVGRECGQSIAWRGVVPRLAEPGVLWVGEAAGLTSPITGEGIWHALAGGVVAGHALDSDRDARVVAAYRWRLRKLFAVPLLSAAGFARFAGSRAFPMTVSGVARGFWGRLATAVLERL